VDVAESTEGGHQEGWYLDPYGLHEARWFSNGTPTKLVRDGEAESYEEPPDEPPPHPPEPITPPAAGNEGPGYRADEPDGDLNQRMAEAAEFGATWGSHIAMPGPRDT